MIASARVNTTEKICTLGRRILFFFENVKRDACLLRDDVLVALVTYQLRVTISRFRGKIF